MAKVCEMCGKRPATGSNISHSHRRTKRRFLPNLHVKKIFNVVTGLFKRTKICKKCLRTIAKKQSH